MPDVSMLFLPVVFYGRRGLEADVFESYMRRSGYAVQMVLTENGYPPVVANKPASIAVIALDSAGRGLELAQRIRSATEGCARVFILANQASLEPSDPTIEVIAQRNNLSEVIKRIQRVSRGN